MLEPWTHPNTSMSGASRVSDETLGFIFSHLDNPSDRRVVSLVCRQWKRVDAHTRKHVQIANCYSVAPAALSRRFPNLQSLKIKGKPRAFEYQLLPPTWGGYARPWIVELCAAYSQNFQSLWLRRMQVTDADLSLLAQSCSGSLLSLKLDKCMGFSTIGLSYIAAYCRSLKTLYLEECEIEPGRGEWLHELALNNNTLEELNFQYAGLDDISVCDLETLVENCKSLRSLKVSEVDILELRGVFSRATALEELGTGCCSSIGETQIELPGVQFPRSIVALSGLYNLTDHGLPVIASLLANLRKLDLKFTLLTQDGYCEILSHCVSLEVLEVRNVLGDAGLQSVARTCRNLRRIRIDDDSHEEGFLTPAGIIPVAQNCVNLEFITMYVADLSNATLEAIADNCKVLRDCRFVLLSVLGEITDLPLDEGVKSLLGGCLKLTRFALYVRRGALTDRGMAYIGEYGGSLKWILLGCAGDSDLGLYSLATGCQSLERLEMRDCPVSEQGMANAAVSMEKNLKFIWVEGYNATESGARILARARPFWNVELCPGLPLQPSVPGQLLGSPLQPSVPGQLLAYNSLAGPRTDSPADLVMLFSAGDDEMVHGNGL